MAAHLAPPATWRRVLAALGVSTIAFTALALATLPVRPATRATPPVPILKAEVPAPPPPTPAPDPDPLKDLLPKLLPEKTYGGY